MKEQSHKDEMSKALKGDFERLRDRGVATTLAPRDDTDAEPAAVLDVPEEEPEPQAVLVAPEPETVTEREPGAEREPDPVTEPAMDAQDVETDEPRTSWLSRMLGR